MRTHPSKGDDNACRLDARSKTRGGLPCEEMLLQPWFLPFRIARAIHALVPLSYRSKMRDFFDDYGCMICGKEYPYGANGMCRRCYNDVIEKLRRAAKRRLKSKLEQRFDLGLLRQARLAKKLLRRFSPARRADSERHRLDTARSRNPVYEALSPRSE
jgi:hypothetical protein